MTEITTTTTLVAVELGTTRTVAIVTSILFTCLIIGIVGLWLLRKNRRINQVDKKVKPKPRADHKLDESPTKAQDISQLKIPTSTDPGLPPHMVLEKGQNLREGNLYDRFLKTYLSRSFGSLYIDRKSRFEGALPKWD